MSGSEPTYVRPWVAWYLKDLVPDSWRIIPSYKLPETLSQPTVTITHHKITKQSQAPQSYNLVNDVTIRIADNHTDDGSAEDALDAQVLTLVHALKASERVIWQDAEKLKANETYLAWDIHVQVLSTNPPEV